MISARLLRRAAPLLAPAVAFLAACSDGNPAAPANPDPTPPAGTPGGPSANSAVLRCTADVAPRTVTCAAADPAGGGVGDLMVGGQNLYVKLRSTNVHMVGAILFADETVQNLLPRPMGTADGVTPAPQGVRVFFSSGPTVTGGSGTVAIANADGAATFTAAGQKFYQWDGILAPGATSGVKTWQFQLDPGVTQFVFTVYVSAPMPGENGYLRLDPPNPLIAPGTTKYIDAWTVTAVGVESMNGGITWTSSDTTVAKVASDGQVTGIANGTATITATDGVRSGSTTVTVGPKDTTDPTLSSFSISPRTLNAGDSTTFTVSAADAGAGVRLVQVQIRSPSGGNQPLCNATAPSTGTRASGAFVCRITIPPGAQAGTWTVQQVQILDFAGRLTQLAQTDLQARAFATTMTVSDATPDATAPTLSGFTLAPSTLTAGDSALATLTVSDAGSGVASALVQLYNAASNLGTSCSATTPATGTAASGTYQCRLKTSTGATNGTWSVSSLQVTDRTGNNTSYTAATLAQRGLPSAITVTGGTDDLNKPTLTSFSVARASATLADSVLVTVGVADPQSGAASIHVEIRSPISSQVATCESAALAAGTAANGTFACRVRFSGGSPAGTWTVYDLELFDAAGNQRTYATGDLKAFGYGTTLTVTP